MSEEKGHGKLDKDIIKEVENRKKTEVGKESKNEVRKSRAR